MSNNIRILYKYLKNKNIEVDYPDFETSVSSHPDYPEIISYVDALNILNIKYDMYSYEEVKDQIDPKDLVIFYDELRELTFEYHPKDDLEEGLVLIVEELPFKKAIFRADRKMIVYVVLLLFLGYLETISGSWSLLVLLICSFAGVYVSYSGLSMELGIESDFSNKFCSSKEEKSSCSSVINSAKKIDVKLGHLSFFFFVFQVFLLGFSLAVPEYMYLFLLGSLLSIPVTVYSLYFQFFVEKKWCTICLSTIAVLYIQVVTGFFAYKELAVEMSLNKFLLLALIGAVSYLATSFVSSQTALVERLKTTNTGLIKFYRNYDLFKFSLIKSKKINLDTETMGVMIGGQQEHDQPVITMISNPTCKYCKETYRTLLDIYRADPESIVIQIVFYDKNFMPESEAMIRNIFYHYFRSGGLSTLELLAYDFEFFRKKQEIGDDIHLLIEEQIQKQNRFGMTENFEFSPTLLINQYVFPENYSRSHIRYFIPDLINDMQETKVYV
ncbi:vitamin K epoxide reductase family protein [Chryseobacterium sp.]|uniref:vitamin K epoxide reductase family protein n=1 Tax=Chryseobacterium sp. TaxID=1871047 RepID=UPI0025C2C9F7|nr:vitamin K epoxide reductase family protein [Chryseobacterium sp.]MBV8327112.1 vitamin K epoxide reductase family protein [Chryseobacterium sp.]